MKKITLIALLMLLSIGGYSQENAFIKGRILDKENNDDPMSFANVILKNTDVGITTNLDGEFEIDVLPGDYVIQISFMGYENIEENISVIAGQTLNFNRTLGVNAMALEEITLVEKINREGKSVLMLERKKATAMVQNVGSVELAEKGASDVSDGVTKMAGISKVSSKYIFVRGMGDRYNNATLNGMPIPSPTPDTKVIPLDIFPMGVVSSVSVDKSFDVSKAGDYAGGTIDITTKASASNRKLTLGLGATANTITTFQPFNSYNGGKTDYIGYDDGTRNLPGAIASKNYYQGSDMNDYFPNNLDTKKSKSPVNISASLGYNDFYSYDNGSSLGILVAGSFSNENRVYDGLLRNIRADNTARIDYKTKQYSYNTTQTGLANLFYSINNDNKIEFTSFYSHLSTDDVKETRGTHYDYDNQIVSSRRFTFKENSLWWNQLRGTSSINDNLTVSYGGTYSIAKSTEPDRRQLVFTQDADIENSPYEINYIDRNENHRFYSWLDENEITAELSAKYVLDRTIDKETSFIEGGLQSKFKERNFNYRQFNYIFSSDFNKYITEDLGFVDGFPYETPDAVINDETFNAEKVKYNERGDVSSKQLFNFNVHSAYARYFKSFGKLDMLVGARLEMGTQTVEYKNQQIASRVDKFQLDDPYLLPSLILKYNLNEAQSLKFSASQTISRPGFREMSNFEYVEDFAGMKSRGNPNLHNGKNYNIDLRWEKFSQKGGVLAFSVFGKYLSTPIEKAMLATASGQLQTYVNADYAYVAGLEAEWTGNLGKWTSNEHLENIEFGVNASYIYSRSTMTDASIPSSSIGGGEVSVVQTNSVRPLEGASPFLINVDAKYRFESIKTNVSLSYNVFGERLIRVGSNNIGDAYEQPVNTLNLVIQSKLTNRLKLKFSAKNILNPTIREIQYQNNVDNVVNEYTKGVNLSLSVNYDLM